jgi:hypothetical protein
MLRELGRVGLHLLVVTVALMGHLVAQNAGPVFMPIDTYEGKIRGKTDRHDGRSEWVGLLETKDGNWLLVGPASGETGLKKFVDKNVTVRGRAATFMREPSGEVQKLEGKVGGMTYQGNLEVADLADVALAGSGSRGLVSTSPLRCRIKKRSHLGKRLAGSLVEVEVTNTGDRPLEPVRFEIDVTPRPKEMVESRRLLDRVEGPHLGRSGRTVPPKGKLSYWLMVGASEESDKIDVVVREWIDGDGSDKDLPVVTIGSPEAATFQELGATHPATSFALDNASDDNLDLFFLATFKRPAAAQAILRVSLGAREHRKTLITHLPSHGYGDGAIQWPGAQVTSLQLVDWSRRGAAATNPSAEPVVVENVSPPAGSGATALAVAWRSSYAYPQTAHLLTGRFSFETKKGGDGVWCGFDKLSGTFRLEGFRGFMNRPPLWSRATFQVDQSIPENLREAINSALADRFQLWAERDFAGRGQFEERFAGTTIEPKVGAPETFVITGGSIREVETAGGRVASLLVDGWPKRRFTWTESLGQSLATTITTGDEVLFARFAAVAGTKDFLMPVEFRFERVFGPDWGPEIFRFDGLTASDSAK